MKMRPANLISRLSAVSGASSYRPKTAPRREVVRRVDLHINKHKLEKKKIYGRAHLKCGRRHPVPRVPIASGGAPECRPSTLDTPPRAAARHPDGCGATARNTSLVRPTGSPHRWVSSLRRPRAPQRRVRASWPRLASEQGCLRAARPGVLALGVLAPRTFVCAHEGTGSSHRWVSSLRFPRAPQRRVRASWPRLVPE